MQLHPIPRWNHYFALLEHTRIIHRHLLRRMKRRRKQSRRASKHQQGSTTSVNQSHIFPSLRDLCLPCLPRASRGASKAAPASVPSVLIPNLFFYWTTEISTLEGNCFER